MESSVRPESTWGPVFWFQNGSPRPRLLWTENQGTRKREGTRRCPALVTAEYLIPPRPKLRAASREVPLWPMAQVQCLAWELPHAAGVALKGEKKSCPKNDYGVLTASCGGASAEF